MEKSKLMQLEIEEKRKLPLYVKEDIIQSVFYTLIVAIILVVYFLSINIMYYSIDGNKFEEYLKFYALGIIIATITLFEIAYRKNSKKIMVIGIELFICGVLTLYIPYIFLHTSKHLRMVIMIVPVITILIYYFIKSMFIVKANKDEYINTLSDVKDIVPDKEHKSYLDENSEKTYRKKVAEEEEIKEVIKTEQVIRREKREELIKKKKGKKQTTKNKKEKGDEKID